MSARIGLAAIVLALALAVLASPAYGIDGLVPPDSAIGGPPTPFGTIVLPHGAGLLFADAGTGVERPVGMLPAVGVNGHATWSPDHATLAVSRFGRRPGERVGGSDILLVATSGGEARPIVEHDGDGALLGAPAWTPDGTGLFYDVLPPNGGPPDSRVYFVHLGSQPGASPEARPVAVGGWPAVSPDARQLAYVRPSPATGYLNELVVVALDGSGERVLVPADQQVQIISPRFSPDGREIAFVGSLTRGEDAEVRPDLRDLFAKGPRAHGPPGDVWIVSLGDGARRRLTTYEEDEPTLAWSPNSAWIAMFGGGGLYVVPRDETVRPYRLGRGGFGGIDWR